MKSIVRIVRFTGSLWRYYLTVSIFTILIALMSQLVPLLTKAAVDEVVKLAAGGEVDVRKVAIFAALIFLTDIATTIFSNIGGHFGDLLSIKQQRLLSNRYYQHVMRLPQKYFDTELSGTIINRMSRGVGQISSYTQVLSNNFLQFLFSTVFTLIIVAYYAWPVALMLLSLYPIFIWMTAKSSGRWQAYQKEINHDLDVASGRFAESVGQVKVVKSFGQQLHELRHYDDLMKKVVRTTKPQSLYWHKQDVFRRTVLSLISFAIYAYIFVETARGRYSVGTMVLLIQYVQLIRIPLFSISFLVDQTQRAIANSRDYFAVIDEEPEAADNPDAVPLQVTEGAISFDKVNFTYSEGAQVLRKVSFDIKPKSKVALVGESGEGKTTITSLLMKLYEPDKGDILIDGQPISGVTQASVRTAIAVVFQEPALFSGSVRENIAYGQPKASLEDIRAASKAANAHEFIEKFEEGYDTTIGERGVKLSGGQKQRIAIARAILKDAPILVLDEATSSLDSRSELLVHEALERLMKNRTTIIIAHRLSTIRSVDQIITIRGGSVDESGTPAELEHSGGIYAQLLELQQMKADPQKQKKLKRFDMADS